MSPCFFDKSGDRRTDNTFITDPTKRDEFYVPCRTVCGNGILDIEEECEPFESLFIADKTPFDNKCLWDVPKEGRYPFCSNQCLCKEGWERNPAFK